MQSKENLFAHKLAVSPLSTLVRFSSTKAASDAMEAANDLLDRVQEFHTIAEHYTSKLLLASLMNVSYKRHGGDYMCFSELPDLLREMVLFTDDFSMVVEAKSELLERDFKADAKNGFIELREKLAAAMPDFGNAFLRRFFEHHLGIWDLAINGLPLTEPEKFNDTLSTLRWGTHYELSDAKSFVTKILSPVKQQTDKTLYDFATNILIGFSIVLHYLQHTVTNKDLLEVLVDPRWDSKKQMVNQILNHRYVSKKMKAWASDTMGDAYQDPLLDSLIVRTHALLINAFALAEGAALQEQQVAPVIDSVQIFDPAAVSRAQTKNSRQHEKHQGTASLLADALKNNGRRFLPDLKNAITTLDAAKLEFENLVEPIEFLKRSFVYSQATGEFRIRPILLLGDPGVGKTMLASALSKSLGGALKKISAGGAASNFTLIGSHSTWTGGKHGIIFEALAESDVASPVIVVDEIDKIGNDGSHPLIPVFLDLFEPQTAAVLKDEFFELEFDASRIIFILTANDISRVSEPLLSRVEVFEVPRPTVAQRERIIRAELDILLNKTQADIEVPTEMIENLAAQTEMDLRRTVSLVRDSFIDSMMKSAKVMQIEQKEAVKKRPIGFLSH
jgi:ATP-dependent Lon protease